MNKTKTAISIGAILLALAGGSWALSFDFSQTTTTIGDTITTNIVNEAMKNDELRKIGTEIALDILCDREPDDVLCEDRP